MLTRTALAPFLSDADPVVDAEGHLDALGLAAIADSLGVQLAPGVRERQSRPRYLTAMAVAAVVCSEFNEDRVADDGVSPPWQVFEWYMVEGLVRNFRDGEDVRGLPGRDKATTAIRQNVPLSAKTYLKTASVFGFHGVYRLLARTLDVVDENRLGEVGYRLVAAWEQEQGLHGFLSQDRDPGKAIRAQLATAVKDGLDKGAVSRSEGWSGWSFFHKHLHQAEVGKQESRIISSALLDPQTVQRSEFFRFIVSQPGQQAWMSGSERVFHQALRKVASQDLAELIDAILLYEIFARLSQDAFDDCLYFLSNQRQLISPGQLANIKSVTVAATRIPELYHELSERLEPFGESVRFVNSFQIFSAWQSAEEWVETVFEHHKRVQMNKPPNGRAPWLDWFDNGKVMVRPLYKREDGGSHDDRYVHAYRTAPLNSFAHDLRLV